MQNTPIAKRLKEARVSAGLSQKLLGIESGIDPSSASARMNQYEKGTHVPSYAALKRIAKALDLPTCYFYAEEDALAEIIKNHK